MGNRHRPPSRSFYALALLALAVPPPAPAAEIEALRVWDGPEHTRAVFDVSGPVEYKLFTLDNPHRVVLDFDGAALARDYAGAAPEGVIKRVRTGARGKGDTRVVLDLAASARPRSFLLAPAEQHGHRLVVDLYAETAAAPPVAAKTVDQAMRSGERDLVVAVDAGHGGEDPGAIGASGTHEKQITLAIARELKRQIDAQEGMRAVLIRDRDYFIPLNRRYALAREARADLFVSIHADAFNKPSASGSSVFVMSTRGATSEAARWLAERENRSDLVGGVSLGDRDDTLAAVLLDLSQSATMKASEDMARAVLAGLKRLGKVHKAEVQRANFVVLRSPDVPSMLVETAFISNPAEERKLKDPAHQRRLAAAVVEGVRDYFTRQPPPGTLFAARGAQPAREHVVARGETLSQIAARHRIPLSALRAANSLEGDLVRVGERLRIPALGPG